MPDRGDLQEGLSGFIPRLFERLARIPGYTWDETAEPFHSSYDNWHVFGFKHIHDRQNNVASTPDSDKATSPRTSPGNGLREAPMSAGSDAGESDNNTEGDSMYQPVVARISTHVLRLEREFHLAKALTQTVDPDCNHLVRPVDLIRLPPSQGDLGPIIVSIFESPGPNYLKDLVNFGPAYYSGRTPTYYSTQREDDPHGVNQIPLPLFMDFAVAATECLEILHHSSGVVHGELRADAFHFNQDNGLVKLINFGSGPRSFENGLSSVRWSSLSKEVGFKDKLQFLAPEQTGRIPAKPDIRTDIYSLGVLFYTMLTREPAFEGQTPMDVIQAVLSKRIPSASTRRLDVPDALSAIIQKMSHKQMDDRYHSTSGLKHDLVELRRLLQEADAIGLKNFTIGTRDVSSTFSLPTAMIGRKEGHDKLVKVIEQVSRRHKLRASKVNSGSLKGMYSISSGSSFSDSYLDSFESGELEDDAASSQGTGSRKGSTVVSDDAGERLDSPAADDQNLHTTSMDSKVSTNSRSSQILATDGPTSGEGANSSGPSPTRRQNSHKVRRRVRCEVVSIAGAAGLGKSCLVQSVQVDARRHGYFATAKFDQAKKAPFEPVLKLMSSLFRQIFSESEVTTEFHNILRNYVKPIWPALHVMLDLPEFLLSGNADRKRPSPVSMPFSQPNFSSSNTIGTASLSSDTARLDLSSSGSSSGSSNFDAAATTRFLRGGSSSRSMRFVETFLDVLRMLTRHKFICLCLDDLQFADEESLELITAIVAAKIKLLLIVTYRPEEIVPEKARSVLESENAHITKIELRPMSEEDIVSYVSATLSRRPEEILPLAMVVQEKSDGNVFFMREMLDTCYRKNCIWYDWKSTRWDFDLDRIFKHFQSEKYGQQLTRDFTLQRLQELPKASRKILAWASLLGHTFSFTLVQKLMSGEFDYDSGQESSDSEGSEKDRDESNPSHRDDDLFYESQADAMNGLQAALQAYILVPAEEEDQFRFSHDRLVEAAGMLRERHKLEKMHYLIAQALMKYHNLDERNLYARSEHVRMAVNLIKERVSFRASYRELLFQAALKASESGARNTALGLFQSCMTLLQDNPWDEEKPDCYYEETLQLHTRMAECYWYQNQSETALDMLQVCFEKARNAVDKAPAWILQSRLFAQRGDTQAAYQSLKKCSATLGFEVRDVSWADCDKSFQELSKRLLSMDREELLEKPMTEDRILTATGAVLIEIVSAAFWTDALLFYEMAMQMVTYHLEKGSYSQVGLGYLHLATVAIARFSNISYGLFLGDIGKALIYKFQDTYAIGRGLTVHSLFVAHLQEHVRQQLPILENAMSAITTSGDRNLALLNLGSAAVCKLYAGEDMVELEDFCIFGPEDIKDWEDDLRGGTMLVAARQVARALQGKTNFTSASEVMCDQYHNTQQYLALIQNRSSNAERPLDLYHTLAMMPLYLFGHYETAIVTGNRCLSSIDELWSIRNAPFMLFYLALSLIASARNNPSTVAREETIKTATQYKEKIQEWQAVSDVNYSMWTLLLKAELDDLSGDYGAAIRGYEDALDHCQQHEFILEEALTFELMGECCMRQGARRTARTILGDAIAAYNRISAFAKSRQLLNRNESLMKTAKHLRTAEVGCQTDLIGDIALNQQYQPEPDEGERQLTRTFSPSGAQDRTQAWITPANANAVTSMEESKNSSPGLAGLGLDMIDLTSILTSSQVISSELQVDRLLAKMTEIILDSAGGQADFAAIVVDDEHSGWSVAASGDPENGVTAFQSGLPLSEVENQVSKQVILYSLRFKDTVFLPNLLEDERFANVSDSYLAKNPAGKAVIALPIIHGGDTLLGMLYLEGQPSSFTDRNLTVLQLLTNQMGISIANALLFKRVQKVSQSNVSMIESQKRALAHAREAEKKAKLAEAEAMRNVRLKEEAARAKSMFLANVSHELRTPLNGVIGMSELLKGTKMTKEQMDYADSIRVCADTLLTVINDILDFSKLEAGKMQMFSVPLNLHETVTEVVRALAFTNLEKGLQTIEKLRLDKDLLVMGDPVRLHQIFMNLLSNSYKFTQKGSVTVEATPDVETDESIQVTFSVADTGIGITEEQLKRLFLPFSQADSSTARSYGGSGLGLSICKAIIENVLSGKIWLKSEPGVGTTVYFTLKFPKAPKDAKASSGRLDRKERKDPDPMAIYSPPKAQSPPPSGRPSDIIDLSRVPRDKLRICIAEDNPINQRIAMSFVAKLGFKADAYSDGRQTVDALRKKANEGNPYHLVLMDLSVQMPVLDGYDATKEIRKDPNPAVRGVLVIAMTASAIRGDREKCIDAGMNNYLAKPVRADVLKKMLEDYLEQPNRIIPNLQREADDMASNAMKAAESGGASLNLAHSKAPGSTVSVATDDKNPSSISVRPTPSRRTTSNRVAADLGEIEVSHTENLAVRRRDNSINGSATSLSEKQEHKDTAAD